MLREENIAIEIKSQGYECKTYTVNPKGTEAVLLFESQRRTEATSCPVCGSPVHIYDSGSVMLRDMPIWVECKDHVKADAKSKFITNYSVTNAAVNDNQEFVGLLKENDGLLYGDCGYVGKKFVEQFPEGDLEKPHFAAYITSANPVKQGFFPRQCLRKQGFSKLPEGVTSMIHEKAEKNHPLTEAQKASNREKSRIRCRIEHIFGYMTGAMHGITVRSIGLTRAKFNIGMMNLVYNLCRYAFLMRPRKAEPARG